MSVMEAMNFIFNLNRNQVDEHLKSINYTKIGHTKDNALGYCILIDKKKYFEIESINNPNIHKSNNISDIKLYCIN